MLGCSWREVWGRYSLAPGRLMGWAPPLTPGSPADFCLVRTAPDGSIERVETFAAGDPG
jgi:hypothetical protein